jgi:hypothetical protein
MNIKSRAIQLLREYLKETPLAERELLWKEAKSLGYGGPTLSEYFGQLQMQLESYAHGFGGEVVSKHEYEINPNTPPMSQTNAFDQATFAVAGESNYAFAA